MMDKSTLLSSAKPEEITIYVKAWGGEVKARPLTIGEYVNTHKAVMNGESGMDALMEAQIQAVSTSLIEPKITAQELRSIDVNKIDGIVEIYEKITKTWEEVPKK